MESLNVNDIDYCENTRNIDNMIYQFKNDRTNIIKLLDGNVEILINLLWSNKSPISYDRKCLFNMGKTQDSYTLEERIEGSFDINESLINIYICPQCKNMKRLIDFSKTNKSNEISKPFTIECGIMAGEKLIVTKSVLNALYMIKESPPPCVAKLLKSPYINSLVKCSTNCVVPNIDQYNIDYLGLDPFTNNMLINWFLHDKLSRQKIPNIINMHMGFVCGDDGFSLYDYPDIGRVKYLHKNPDFLEHNGQPSPTSKANDNLSLERDVVKGIIKQLFALLHDLRKYDFSHGGPSTRSILFTSEPCSYMYDGYHIESPTTLKLCDFNYAGITVANKINGIKTRLYNKSIIANEEIMKNPFRPIIDTIKVKPFSFKNNNESNDNTNDFEKPLSESINIYRIKDSFKHFQEALIFMYIKHLGFPVYQSSFDVYGFMVSLMSEPSFFSTVMRDESMYLLWRNMWLPEEFEIIQEKMRKLHETDSMTRVSKVLRVLSGFGLRCNMINYGWDMIKTW